MRGRETLSIKRITLRRWFKDAAEKLKDDSGAGVIELVLIIVVLIALVLIFKSQIMGLMQIIFAQIESSATSVF